MKKIIFEKWKLINFGLFLLLLALFIVMYLNYKKWFQNTDIMDIYKSFDSFYHPVMVVSKWLAGIFAFFLIMPSQVFKKWLFFVALPIMLVIYYLVQSVSVFSGNLLNPTRAQMAEDGMIVLSGITIVFVLGYLVYDWKKGRISQSKL